MGEREKTAAVVVADPDADRIGAEAIAAKNAKVDLKVVEEARDLIAERRANGRQPRGYNLAYGHSRYAVEA
jgi:hypothetical protein